MRGHFSSALLSGNDPGEPVLEQLRGERPERGRKNINHQKFSWFNYGFFKKLFLEVHPSLDPLTPSLTLDSLHLLIQNSFLSTYCVHTVCV